MPGTPGHGLTGLRGETLKLADTWSRAFLPEVNTTDFTEELASIDHRATLPVSEARWMQVNKESADDAVMSELRTVILNGWPETRAEVPESLKPYFDVRDEERVRKQPAWMNDYSTCN